MKSKVFNICLVLTVVIVLGVCAFYVRIGVSADSVVVLKTAGMTCASFGAKVTTALQRERGVAATEVDLQGGWVIAGFDSKKVAPEQLARQVSAAGFSCKVQTVLTPEQFRKIAGRNIGNQANDSGCCGSKGCGAE